MSTRSARSAGGGGGGGGGARGTKRARTDDDQPDDGQQPQFKRDDDGGGQTHDEQQQPENTSNQPRGRPQLLLNTEELRKRTGKKYCDEAELVPLLLAHGLVRRVRTIAVEVRPLSGESFDIRLNAKAPTVGEAKEQIEREEGTEEPKQLLCRVQVSADGSNVREFDQEPEELKEDGMELSEGDVIAMGVHDPVLSVRAVQTAVDRGRPLAVDTVTNAFPDGQQPVLQVLGIVADEEDPGWYNLVVSDGQLSIIGALYEGHAGHAALVESGQLAKFSIVKLNQCEVGKVNGGTIVLVVHQLEVVHDASYSGAAQLGTPSHEHVPQHLHGRLGLA
jgi:hypothetical protein